VSASKDRGTRSETLAVRYLREHGFPQADRQPLRGNRDSGDLVVCRKPLIVAEVKSRKRLPSRRQVRGWWGETETGTVRAGGDLGVLIVHQSGVSVADWQAVMPAADWAYVLTSDPGTLLLDAPWLLACSLADWAVAVSGWADA